MKKAKSESGIDQEGSTTRTEAPASNPIAAGRDLDALVAERVMGLAAVGYYRRVSYQTTDWERCNKGDPTPSGRDAGLYYLPEPTRLPIDVWPVDEYSTDIAAAWAVVGRMQRPGDRVTVYLSSAGTFDVEIYNDETCLAEVCDEASAPLAICLAALQAFGATYE